MRKIIILSLVSILLTSCNTPTPKQDLLAAVAALDIISVLPNLTPADRAWISAASQGLSCSSTVLAKNEPKAQEALDITACFSNLPIVPAADQPYISAGIGLVNVFISLFVPTGPSSTDITNRMNTIKDVTTVTKSIHDRVTIH